MFISKLKDLGRFNKRKKELFDLSALQDNLNDGLFKVMESSFSNRKNDSSNSNFSAEDIDKIIKGYATKNMLLASASSIIPGPLGILGSLPELIINMGNQMNMIYDLGCANQKENFINKDLLIDIPFAAFGGNTNLMDVQNFNEDLLHSPVDILQEKMKTLGGSMIEKTLKKSIVQFIPVAGPVLMGIWSKKTTSKIATISTSFFDQEANYSEHVKLEETDEIKARLQVEKIKGLANLIEANNDINEEQIAFIGPIIENAEVPQSQKNHLLEESLKTSSNFQLDYQLLKDYEEDDDLVVELVIMAKRSGSVDELEKQYIYQVARDLALRKEFVDELLQV